MRNGSGKESGKESGKKQQDADDTSGGSMITKGTTEIQERLTQWRDILGRETRERPGRSAAIALSAGYLLGGGLFSPLTARIVSVGVKVGLRVALIPFVTQTLAALGENLFAQGGAGGGSRAPSDDDDSGERTSKNQKRNPDQKETHS